MTAVLVTTLVATSIFMVGVWLLSLWLSDASVVDVFWSLGFILVGATALAMADAPPVRAWLLLALVVVWGLRLSIYLAVRSIGRGEDYRYRAMRTTHGPRFPIVSLGTVFLLQAGLVWVVSLPLQAVPVAGVDRPLGGLDALGVVLWVIGLGIEWTADVQLARFKRDPSSAGRVLDRGVWRYSRHPNYFGECVLWWGFGAFGAAAGAWWTLIGPVVMTVLLLKVSGVAMLERTIAERRPAYRDYIRRTSAFVPWLPRETGHRAQTGDR